MLPGCRGSCGATSSSPPSRATTFAMMAFGGENGGRTETVDAFLGQKRGVGVKHQLEEKLLKI